MINLIQQPFEASFSGNPVDFCFTVDKPDCCSLVITWGETLPELSIVMSDNNVPITGTVIPAGTEDAFVQALELFFGSLGNVVIQPLVKANEVASPDNAYTISFCNGEAENWSFVGIVNGSEFDIGKSIHPAKTYAKFDFDDYTDQSNFHILDQYFPTVNNPGPDELPIWDYNTPIADYWEIVKEFLECRDPFMCDWDLEIVDDRLCFTAKEPGIQTLNDQDINFRTPLQIEIQQDCEIVIQPFVEKEKGSGVFEKTARLAKCVVDDLKVPFDLQSILHSCMKKKNVVPDIPVFGTGDPFDAELTHKSFYLKYALQTNGATGKFETTDIFQSYYGGLDYHAYPGNSFFEDLKTNQCFLTWQKSPKRASQVQHEYLSYIFCDPSVTGAQLEVDIVLEGGVNDNFKMPLQSVDQWCKKFFPAGYTQLGLCERYEGVTIPVCEWTVRLLDQDGNVISKDFTYKFACHEKGERYFIFENSLGGLDTVRMSSNLSTDITKTGVSSERKLGSDYDKTCGELFTICNLTQESYEIETNRLKDDCAVDYIKDLLRSEYVAELLFCQACGCDCPDSSVGCYSPVILKQGKFKKDSFGTGARRLRIRFEEAFTNQWFTPLICKCPDSAGLTVLVTKEQLPGCCPIVGAENRARLYRRRFGNQWRVYGWLPQLQNAVIAAGGTNLVYNQIVTDIAGNTTGITPIIWGNPSFGTRVYVRMPLSLTQVKYQAAITFDIDCGNGVQQVQFRLEEICTVPIENGWQLEFLTPECVDLTILTQCCIKIEPADSIAPGSVITSQTTTLSLDGGNSGTSVALPFDACFDETIVEAIQVVRQIKTSLCSEFLKVVENVETPTPCECELKLDQVLLASDDYTGNFLSVFNDNRPGAVKAFSIQWYQSSVVFEFLVDLNCDVLQIGNYRFLSAACTFNSSPGNSYQDFSIHLNFDFDSFSQFGDCAEKAEEIMNEMISNYNTFEDNQEIWHPEFTCYNLSCE